MNKSKFDYINDILFAHDDKSFLAAVMGEIRQKLERIRWHINYQKWIFEPVESIEFLGSSWSSDGFVKRSPDADILVKCLIDVAASNNLGAHDLHSNFA